MSMIRTSFRTALAAAALTVVAGAAHALPASGIFAVSQAPGDPAYYSGGSSHAIYLPGVAGGSNFVFNPFSGGNLVIPPGAATMSLFGQVVSTSNAAYSFDVTIDFDLIPSATPKKELSNSAYAPGPGGIDTGTWDYYLVRAGSKLIGTAGSLFDGLTLNLSQAPAGGPYASQIGFGANGKNLTFGLSTWFTYTSTVTGGYSGPTYSGQGDVNVNVIGGGTGTNIPEPAALGLFGLGLAGLGLAARRRQRA
jgi:hypothetical protein